MPDEQSIETVLLDTLNRVPFDFPIPVEDIFLFLLTHNTIPGRKELLIALDVLARDGAITIDQGHIFKGNIPDAPRLAAEKNQRLALIRDVLRAAERDFKWARSYVGIEAILADTDTRRAQLNTPYILPLIFCIDPKQRTKIERQLKWRFLLSKKKKARYAIEYKDRGEFSIHPQHIEAAFWFLHIRPVVNMHHWYETCVKRNTWIFSIFTQYPFQKISSTFKVTSTA